MADPEKDEHIEELLSKLQGIFGKLSHSEEDEEKQKVETPLPTTPKTLPPQEPLPTPAPASAPIPTPASIPVSAPPTMPKPFVPAPNPAPKPFVPAVSTEPASVLEPISVPTPPVMPPVSTPETTALGGYESTVPLQDAEKMIVPTALFYPPGREAEAKSVAQKLETMTPKFTKVAFRLRVIVFTLYDPKSEWKDSILSKGAEAHFQTVFVLMDRPLDDVKRKAIAAELEGSGIYFQEVPTTSIEKKAFYTDVLLGLVFFLDSRKPNTGAQEQTP